MEKQLLIEDSMQDKVTEPDYISEAEFIELTAPQREKDFIEWQNYLTNLVCSIYGISPEHIKEPVTIKVDEKENAIKSISKQNQKFSDYFRV